MVTKTLRELLNMKEQYNQRYPNGEQTMSARSARAYRNLLTEIRKAGRRAQGTFGFDVPAADGQLTMFQT